MTINDFSTDLLKKLNNLCAEWFDIGCPEWEENLANDCYDDCPISDLCALLDYYDTQIEAELIKRGEFNNAKKE